MEMTGERIGFTFDPRDMLLCLQIGFSFVRAAMACAILGRISGLKPSSESIAPRYLKLAPVLRALMVVTMCLSVIIETIYILYHEFSLAKSLLRYRLLSDVTCDKEFRNICT